MWGILVNIWRRYRILPLFLVNYGENVKKKQDLCHLGNTVQGLYSCIHCSSITNAVNESSISRLTHLHVCGFYYSFLSRGFTGICIELFLYHEDCIYFVSPWVLCTVFWVLPAFILSCYISPLGCNTPSPSYKAIDITLNNHSATFINQSDIFCAITTINNIYFCIVDDTLR